LDIVIVDCIAKHWYTVY